MEKIFTRYVVTLVFALWASACFADIDENFNSLTPFSTTPSLPNWTFINCDVVYNGTVTGNTTNRSIRFNAGSSAVTPAVGQVCNARLNFSHRRSDKTLSSSFKVILNGGGSFDLNNSVVEQSVTVNNANFLEQPYAIYGATKETTVKFEINSVNNFVIDDVKLTTSTPVSISETGTATAFEAQLADVTLGRTLSAGVWSTLCLPFDVTTEAMQTATRAADVKMCTFDSYEDGTMTFKKTDEVTAGTPFLIKVNTTVINPTFLLVDVKNTAAQTEAHGDVSMVGCYGQTNLDSDGERMAVFLTADGSLKRPNSASSTMKGLRAYFIVPKSFAGARVMIDNEEVTTIDAVLKPESTGDGELYSLTGQRQTQSVRPGIYINNGKKVVIK